MTVLLVIIHVIVCVALIMIVLLQTGKGADIGAAFGGGASNTLFGTCLLYTSDAAAVENAQRPGQPCSEKPLHH